MPDLFTKSCYLLCGVSGTLLSMRFELGPLLSCLADETTINRSGECRSGVLEHASLAEEPRRDAQPIHRGLIAENPGD